MKSSTQKSYLSLINDASLNSQDVDFPDGLTIIRNIFFIRNKGKECRFF